MILNLQDYDFELHYTPGKDNVVADALSRNPVANYTEMISSIMNMSFDRKKEEIILQREELIMLCAMAEIPVPNKITKHSRKATGRELRKAKIIAAMVDKQYDIFKIDPLELANMQVEDESLQECRRKAMEDKNGHTWVINNECLHHIRYNRQKGKKNVQLVLPEPLRKEVMQAHHDELLGGHCGYLKTYHKIAQWYWWPKMSTEIKDWVQHCSVCQTHSRNYGQRIGNLQPVIAKEPFEIIGVDILTKLPKTARGNHAIVVFTDYFTKWVEAYPIDNEEAITIANQLIKGVMCRHGAVKRIISDRGNQFTFDLFREVTELLGMKQNMTVAYNPMADGQAEKAIGTLHNTLSKLAGSNAKEWDLLIPYALWAYRTAVHATTKETPFFMVYGREAENPTDVKIRQWMDSHTPKEYTKLTADRLLDAYERVRVETKRVKQKMKENFDENKKDNPFKLNDLVWYKIGQKTKDENRKLSAKYEGPYKIFNIPKGEHQLNVDIMHLNNPENKHRVSVRQLKIAKLKPNQVGENTTAPVPEITTPIEEVEAPNIEEKPIANPKGRNIFTQAKRKGVAKKAVDNREKYEVEDILEQGTNRKTGKPCYLVKWKGYTARHNWWVEEEDMQGSSEILNEWHRKQKAAKAAKTQKSC